jgi:phosphate transport system permease protein
VTTLAAARTGAAGDFARVGADWRGQCFLVLLLLSLLTTLLVLLTLIADVAIEGGPALAERGLAFLTSNMSNSPDRSGVWQGLVGSFLIAAIVTFVAFPVGIATAVYLEEYATDSLGARAIAVNIRNLAGVPSVVYGLLGLAVFVQALGGLTGGRSVIAGGLTLAVLVLPIVIITSAEAIRAVPSSIREAGYGVGASRWQVVRGLVLPSAAPGILTGTVLSLSRALGETAPLILVGAAFGYFSTGRADFFEQLFSSFTALPMIIFGWSRLPQQSEWAPMTAAAIIVLLLVTLSINAVAILLRNRFERSW